MLKLGVLFLHRGARKKNASQNRKCPFCGSNHRHECHTRSHSTKCNFCGTHTEGKNRQWCALLACRRFGVQYQPVGLMLWNLSNSNINLNKQKWKQKDATLSIFAVMLVAELPVFYFQVFCFDSICQLLIVSSKKKIMKAFVYITIAQRASSGYDSNATVYSSMSVWFWHRLTSHTTMTMVECQWQNEVSALCSGKKALKGNNWCSTAAIR